MRASTASRSLGRAPACARTQARVSAAGRATRPCGHDGRVDSDVTVEETMGTARPMTSVARLSEANAAPLELEPTMASVDGVSAPCRMTLPTTVTLGGCGVMPDSVHSLTTAPRRTAQTPGL